jgi:chromosome segregation ATPase
VCTRTPLLLNLSFNNSQADLLHSACLYSHLHAFTESEWRCLACCRALEEERRRFAVVKEDGMAATAARDTWKHSHATAEAQLKAALLQSDALGKDAAAARAAGTQLEEEVERLRREATGRESAFADALRQLDAAVGQLREREAAGGEAAERAGLAEARACAAEEGVARLHAANEELKAQCVPVSGCFVRHPWQLLRMPAIQ